MGERAKALQTFCQIDKKKKVPKKQNLFRESFKFLQ